MSIRHVLVPCDLSDVSLRAIRTAHETFPEATVTVLHVVPEIVAVPHGAPFAPPVEPPDIGKHVEAARKELDELLGEGDPREVVASGDAAQSIADRARELGVDLVCMTTHGRSGLRRLVLGSVAEGVLRRSTVPVLCLPPEEGAVKS